MSRFLCLVLLAGCLTGCMDASLWYARKVYGVDCRPEKLTPDGRCVPVQKESSSVQTAHP